jgi:hypothetical protein
MIKRHHNPKCKSTKPKRCVVKTELSGRVVTATDASYETDRQNLIQLYQTYPHYIVFAQDENDVLNAIKFARENDISFRMRSGRCSTMGWCGVDNGITIDVSEMKEIRIDTKRKTITAGSGVTQAEITNALTNSGFYTSTGNEGILGMIGVLLGGGIGLLSRIKGIGCYNLLSVKAVIPSGKCSAKFVKADLCHNSDLLYACRGGGGNNICAVTEFTMALFPQPPTIVVFDIVFPFNQIIEVFDAWQHWAPFAESRLSSNINCFSDHIDVHGIFIGTLIELDNLLSPLTSLPNAVVTLNEMPFSSFYHLTVPPEEPFLKFSPMIPFRLYPLPALEIIQQFVSQAPSPKSNFFGLAFGKAVKRLPKGGSAVPFFDAPFYTEASAEWHDASMNDAVFNWVQSFRLALQRYFELGYVNVLAVEIADFETQYYGKNQRRLAQIKAKYDPHNIFYFDQSVRPPSKR